MVEVHSAESGMTTCQSSRQPKRRQQGWEGRGCEGIVDRGVVSVEEENRRTRRRWCHYHRGRDDGVVDGDGLSANQLLEQRALAMND